MDPNATLNQIRALVTRLLSTPDAGLDAYDLAERVSALDSWIIKGGFLPDDWTGPGVNES